MRVIEIFVLSALLCGLGLVLSIDTAAIALGLLLQPTDVGVFAVRGFVLTLAAGFLVFGLKNMTRWQLFPAYLAFLFFALSAFESVQAVGLSKLAAIAGLALLLCAFLLSWALPMFRFARMTGSYPVGTSIHCLIDSSRADDSPSGHRELMIQLWYPAKPSRNTFNPYRQAKETTRVSSYQSVLKTQSRLRAPVADCHFPVLLFNPAWNGRRTQNTFLTEELASHGFVVAAIDHTGNSEPVAFPDGRMVMAEHVRAMEDVSTSTAEEVQRIGNTEVDRQALDCRFVLDELARWNGEQGSAWSGRLDTERAGAFGHSLGGATSVECWATDPRVRAAMNMDGWTFGTQASTGHRAEFPERNPATGASLPLLFIYEGSYHPEPDPTLPSGKSDVEKAVDAWDAAHVRALLRRHGGYRWRLQGADHMNFTDRTISSPLRRLAGGGAIDPRLAHRILRACAVSFFSQALKGERAALLANPAVQFPALEVLPVPEGGPRAAVP